MAIRKEGKDVDVDYIHGNMGKITNIQGIGKQFIDTNTQERKLKPMNKLRTNLFSTNYPQSLLKNIGSEIERTSRIKIRRRIINLYTLTKI